MRTDGLDGNLQKLVVSVVASNMATWRDLSSNNELSLPTLKEFDWRIDIKTSSDKVARMSVPTALVQVSSTNQMASSKRWVPGGERERGGGAGILVVYECYTAALVYLRLLVDTVPPIARQAPFQTH